jgi:hypothetical protein
VWPRSSPGLGHTPSTEKEASMFVDLLALIQLGDIFWWIRK